MEDEVICKCGQGWSCVITKTEPSQIGVPFSKCGGNSSCNCTTGASIPSITSGKVYCKCGPGWTCMISKTDGSEAGKSFVECGEGCVCVIDETDAVKVTRA